jgi:hypothetical protein
MSDNAKTRQYHNEGGVLRVVRCCAVLCKTDVSRSRSNDNTTKSCLGAFRCA